jgi:hypothetical protein
MYKKLVGAFLLLAAATLALAACSRAPTMSDRETLPLEAPAAPFPGVAQPAMEQESFAKRGGEGDDSMLVAASTDRKIIYNVSLHLIVQDTEIAFGEVQRVAEEMGGFVAGSNVWRDQEYQRASVTVRVPADKLQDALARFRALAVDVENQRLDSQDVTEEYVDLEARLTNAQRTERELQELLESRSEKGRTSDILEVHRELTSIRAQIEQIQGRMQYLDNLSEMATVQIELTPDALMQPVVVAGWRPQGTARDAVRTLLRTLQFLADAVIVFVLFILPVLIVIAIPVVVLILIIRALVRRHKRRKAERAAKQE